MDDEYYVRADREGDGWRVRLAPAGDEISEPEADDVGEDNSSALWYDVWARDQDLSPIENAAGACLKAAEQWPGPNDYVEMVLITRHPPPNGALAMSWDPQWAYDWDEMFSPEYLLGGAEGDVIEARGATLEIALKEALETA